MCTHGTEKSLFKYSLRNEECLRQCSHVFSCDSCTVRFLFLQLSKKQWPCWTCWFKRELYYFFLNKKKRKESNTKKWYKTFFYFNLCSFQNRKRKSWKKPEDNLITNRIIVTRWKEIILEKLRVGSEVKTV